MQITAQKTRLLRGIVYRRAERNRGNKLGKGLTENDAAAKLTPDTACTVISQTCQTRRRVQSWNVVRFHYCNSSGPEVASSSVSRVDGRLRPLPAPFLSLGDASGLVLLSKQRTLAQSPYLPTPKCVTSLAPFKSFSV